MYGLAEEKYTKKISLIQKRAISLISNAAHNTHTEPLFQELQILSFEKVLEFQFSILMWEYDHNDLPDIFDIYFERAKHTHSHETRFACSKKLAVNMLVSTDLHGQKITKICWSSYF